MVQRRCMVLQDTCSGQSRRARVDAGNPRPSRWQTPADSHHKDGIHLAAVVCREALVRQGLNDGRRDTARSQPALTPGAVPWRRNAGCWRRRGRKKLHRLPDRATIEGIKGEMSGAMLLSQVAEPDNTYRDRLPRGCCSTTLAGASMLVDSLEHEMQKPG
ncbi:hypothetical protein BU16DRAFT_544256 [Lophium mytilinum]|uniref:Uncharacterized protein n=1 Tax=Lophium mytilinum TaxID=390894 RepID=A0A6A6QCW2_9PEZI|nr:hypothetical protein BU16DRAFT_544256 [Lophium mytilinum]